MKKGILVLFLCAIVAAGAFAQFGLGASVSTNFIETTYPTIDVVYGLEKIDILGGMILKVQKTTLTVESSSDSYRESYFGLYGGVAPKAQTSGNWSFSIPLLVNLLFGKDDPKFQQDYFGLAFEAGGRATYSLSDHWSLYTGFVINILTYSKNGPFDEIGGKTTTKMTTFFNTGIVQLGFLYTFKK